MPNRPRTKADSKLPPFVQRLKAVVDSLPDEKDKRDVLDDIACLVSFLDRLRETVAALPSAQGVDDTRAALSHLEEIFDAQRHNKLVADLMYSPRKTSRSDLALTDEEKKRGEHLAEELLSLPFDDVEARLSNEQQYSMRELRAIANHFSLRTNKRLSRASMTHQIAMKVANSRGYRAMRSGGG